MGDNRHYNHLWFVCNWLGISLAETFAAIRKLHSVLRVPPPRWVKLYGSARLQPFHKSFSDYILSPSRS
ncbi:hypothetical protein AN958_06558 [Leucoagaricus sp. SymC.cos]|nr:hypothetical protein AN958_06558 [Leucoagaricus sp. SymC.cos]